MENEKHDYYIRVATALAECQLVEFELKFYIANALELAETKPTLVLPFKMTPKQRESARKAYKDAPLGPLTKMFARLSDAPLLVAELKTFAEERNNLAHKFLAACLDPDGELDRGMAAKLSGRVRKITAEAKRLNDAIHAAGMKWTMHLYFDKIEDSGALKRV